MVTRKTPTEEMVDRFLGWRIPKGFCPDGGITFTPPAFAGSWPTGTNLFCADQAKEMFEVCSAPLLAKMEKDAETIAHLQNLAAMYSFALDEANKEIKELSAKRQWWKFWQRNKV